MKAKPKLEFKDEQIVIQMKLLFRRAKIIPEENEYFMRLDQVIHFIKIKHGEKEVTTPHSSPGLMPEWEFKLDFLL